MMLAAAFPPDTSEFDEGAQAFISLLHALKRLRYFDAKLDSCFGKTLQEETNFLTGFREHDRASAADDLPDKTMHNVDVVGVDYWWGMPNLTQTTLAIDFNHPHPVHGYHIDLFIDTIITWKRPLHVRCGQPLYFLYDHPLDKARSGLGCQGGLPFVIAPSEVPAAAIVLPMQGGTFLASQRDWWIAAGPERNVAAVQRAQALEMRLNVMGVLPTTIELRRGDWGQGGLRS